MLKKILITLGIIVVIIAGMVLSLAINVHQAARARGRAQYVAMGSSFVAGPGVSKSAAGSPFVCARSNENYPHLLARKRHLDLVDMSCSGANTRHVLQGGQMLQDAQLSAVNQDTELVTVTIGGNDVAYMGNLIALGCDSRTQFYARLLGACHVKSDAQVEKSFAALPGEMAQIADQVHLRAPKARLVFVNYFTVLPESGTCERLGLSVEAADRMRIVAARLKDITRDVALSKHADLFDLASLSAPHNVCAADPWLVGMHPPAVLAAPLHPNLEGMRAAADGLDQFLDQPAAVAH